MPCRPPDPLGQSGKIDALVDGVTRLGMSELMIEHRIGAHGIAAPAETDARGGRTAKSQPQFGGGFAGWFNARAVTHT
jgi:hypothetical protein